MPYVVCRKFFQTAPGPPSSMKMPSEEVLATRPWSEATSTRSGLEVRLADGITYSDRRAVPLGRATPVGVVEVVEAPAAAVAPARVGTAARAEAARADLPRALRLMFMVMRKLR